MRVGRPVSALILCIFLSACSVPANPITGSGSIRDIIHTASGYVLEVSKQAAATIELGKMGIEKAKETVGDVKTRVDQVQKGVGAVKQGIQAVKDGKALIEKGLAK